jgi:hypothetical protein
LEDWTLPSSTISLVLEQPQFYVLNVGGFGVSAVAAGDFNGDHHPDLVVLGPVIDQADMYVLLNKGNGTFQDAVAYPIASYASLMAVGDFNGDHRLDIAILGESLDFQESVVAVLLGNGDGTFQPAKYRPIAFSADSMAVGDFTGDGRDDLVLSQNGNPNLELLLSKGDGTFQPAVSIPIGPSLSMAVTAADLNGDGKSDIAVSRIVADPTHSQTVDDRVSFLLSRGDGTFQAPVVMSLGDAIPDTGTGLAVGSTAITTADFNGDGTPDVAAEFLTPTEDHIHVLANQGDGTLRPVADIPPDVPSGSSAQLAAADFDDDGTPDLLAGPNLFLNQGDGTSWDPQIGANPASSPDIAADFNGDGRADVASESQFLTNVITASVYINSTDTIPPHVAITSPPDQLVTDVFPAIAGTAVDNPGGVGVVQVLVQIIRRSDGQGWEPGTGWEPGGGGFDANLDTAHGTWDTSGLTLPTGADLTSGEYTITAAATDLVGNFSTATATIRIDDSPPQVAITGPDDHVVAPDFSGVRGTVSSPSGAAIADMRMEIERLSDAMFWDPAVGWVAQPSLFPAALNAAGGTWRVAGATLPSGSNLVDGAYIVHAFADDQLGLRSVAALSLSVNRSASDRTPPTAAVFSAPIPGAAVTNLPVFAGTARDNPGGSGIAHVALLLERTDDKTFWTGSAATGWSATRIEFAAALEPNGQWSAPAGSLPAGADLPDGHYIVWAYSYDQAGNRSDSGASFTVQLALTITAPDFHVVATSLSGITGTATDNLGSGDIAGVSLLLRRASDGLYWSPGTGWVDPRTTFAAVQDGTHGAWTTEGVALPTGSDLPAGQYTLWTYASDRAGHRADAAITLAVDPAATDTTPPAPASFTAPLAGASATGLSSIIGTAHDNPGGSGVGRVELLIERASDGKYWTGSSATGWSAQRTEFATDLKSDGDWAAPGSSLPLGVDLPSGVYYVWAYTYDRSGNRSDSGARITVTA